MARGRMIDKKLIISRKVNSVSLGAECLYVRVLLLTDDFGRYHADPRILKSHAFSLRRVTERAIIKWLIELVDAGLIKLYSIDSEEYLEVVRFEDFQTFRSDRTRKEEFSKPKKYHSDIPLTYQRQTVVDHKIREVKLSESKLSKEKSIKCSDPECQNLDHWECAFNTFWKSYPKPMGKTDTHSLFLTLCRKGLLKDLIQGYNGYIDYLQYQRNENNFDQAPMNSARFLRKDNWREFMEFKKKARL